MALAWHRVLVLPDQAPLRMLTSHAAVMQGLLGISVGPLLSKSTRSVQRNKLKQEMCTAGVMQGLLGISVCPMLKNLREYHQFFKDKQE